MLLEHSTAIIEHWCWRKHGKSGFVFGNGFFVFAGCVCGPTLVEELVGLRYGFLAANGFALGET
jgi:hypothetical protein